MTDRPDITRERATEPNSAARRRRMDPDQREAHIVEGAIRFFAEHGFEGKTRNLARQIGITQPLLYRYFPSKDSLIERVYQEVYIRRWRPEWQTIIANRSIPLVDRLTWFYQEYSTALYDYVWVRIFVRAGLKGDVDINERYLTIVRDRVLRTVCTELRHDNGLPMPDEVPISDEEIEVAWGLHGSFFYRAVRRYVYNLDTPADTKTAIANDVAVFVAGAGAVQKRIIEKQIGT